MFADILRDSLVTYAVAQMERKKKKKKDSASVPVAFVRENECHAFHFSLHVRVARKTCCTINPRRAKQDSRKTRSAKNESVSWGELCRCCSPFFASLLVSRGIKSPGSDPSRSARMSNFSHWLRTGDFYFRQLERNGIVSSETYLCQHVVYINIGNSNVFVTLVKTILFSLEYCSRRVQSLNTFKFKASIECVYIRNDIIKCSVLSLIYFICFLFIYDFRNKYTLDKGRVLVCK